MSTRDFHDQTAVAGIGTTPFRDLYGRADRSAYDLGAQAFTAALADSGLSRNDVDGVVVCRIPDHVAMCNMLGIRYPKLMNSFQGAGRMSGASIQYAAMAVHAGLADVVACIYGNNGRSAGARYGGEGGPDAVYGAYDSVYGMTSPGAAFAHMFQRYQHEFGPSTEALATLAINNREMAMRNPIAVMQTPITRDDYFNSRFIAEPLRLFDYCLINDGGVCVIVTSAERARDLRKPVVKISAIASSSDVNYTYAVDDWFYPPASAMAQKLFGDAGVAPRDVRVAELYDNFIPNILFSLEALGFCPHGESRNWVAPGRIGLDGALPINTSGGHTSESYMQGWALIAEAVRQARGECNGRQVGNCDVALYACVGQGSNAILFTR